MLPFRVIEMDHIMLSVADVERSLAFYTGTLGLPGERVEDYRAGKVGFPSVRISDDTLIDIMAKRGEAGPGRNLDHFCLVLAPVDMQAVTEHLRAQGVTIVTEPASRWGAHGRATSVYILDPDGNEVELRRY